MYHPFLRRALLLGSGFLGIWLFLRYLFPLALPFLLGLLLALTAEPAVRAGTQLLKLPRWASAGLGVSLTLILLVCLIGIVGATILKELGQLINRLPDLQSAVQDTTDQLRFFLEDAADHVPQGVRPLVDQSISRIFSSGSELVDQATVRLPHAISKLLNRVPSSALGIGTSILSGFMLSVRLPQLKTAAIEKIPEQLRCRLFPALKRSKKALSGWLKAQFKLSGITYGIVTLGFLLLQVPLAPLLAVAVALVDAVPLLGTGTILLPWAVVCLIQRDHLRSIGLLCIYAAAALTRITLEPRLVGHHLGLDPFVTLVFLYLGYQFWGIGGMLFAPVFAAALTAAGQHKDVAA